MKSIENMTNGQASSKNRSSHSRALKSVAAIGLIAFAGAALSMNVSAVGAPASDPVVASSKISKINISTSDYIQLDVTGSWLKEQFPKGFKPGYGSAMAYKGTLKDGSVEYYVIGDRGPNSDGPKVVKDGVTYKSTFFVDPTYAPKIGVLKIAPNGAVSLENNFISLKNKSGDAINGRPYQSLGLNSNLQFQPNLSLVADTGEVGLDSLFNVLIPHGNPNKATDISGLDCEGLAVDKNGNFWVSDEYGPLVVQFDSTGKEIKCLKPGDGLPEVLSHRIPNRGLENLSIAPNGKIFTVEQSVLDIDGKGETSGKNGALFARIVEIDPTTGSSKMYGYPLEASDGSTIAYKNAMAMKLGDVFALSDNKLLIIEQGKDKDGKMHNELFTVDLSKATDLTGKKTADNKELEYATASDIKSLGINLGTKTKLVDLRKYGWTAEKAEGICVNPDGKTITVINDNDYGLGYTLENPYNKDTDITNYCLDKRDNTWSYSDGKQTVKVNDPKVKFLNTKETKNGADVGIDVDYALTIKLKNQMMTPYDAK